MPSTQPNVLLIHADDLGRHLGCYGFDVETPNIDRLAEEGLRCDRHFCTSPQCSPSRGSILTGNYPQRHGLLGLAHFGWSLDDDQVAMPTYFAAEGYSTHRIGQQHVEDGDESRLGYQHSGPERMPARELADAFVDTIDALTDDPPFFATLGFDEPHPHQNENGDWVFGNDRYDGPPPQSIDVPGFMPDDAAARKRLSNLTEEILHLDEGVGVVLDALEDRALLDETVVVLTTDHGIDVRRGKNTCFDGGIGTALLIRYPDRIAGGRTYDGLLSNIDLLPTLLEFVGIDSPTGIDGRSFAPVLDDEADAGRDRIFAQQTWHGGRPSVIRSVRTRRYKYIENYLTLAGGSKHAGDRDRRSGEEEWPPVEMYDLASDPNEKEPLTVSGESQSGARCAVLQRELHAWMNGVGDPLVQGHLILPHFDREQFDLSRS